MNMNTKIKIPAGSPRNQCGSCKMCFNSMSAFEHHRYGPYSDRKCRTPTEMVERNFYVNDRGFWAQMPDARYSEHLATLMEN
jgi:hypothetical protein